MIYQPEKEYKIEIALADETKDFFKLKGDKVEKLREKIFQSGYVRKDKVNPHAVTYWISPFLISLITVTELNQTLTDKPKK